LLVEPVGLRVFQRMVERVRRNRGPAPSAANPAAEGRDDTN
jgi:hypothetical protein